MLSNASLMFTRFSLPVLDDFTDQDMRNIERIYKNVLMTTNSREQQKALVKKYLGWVSGQLKKERRAVLFVFVLFFLSISKSNLTADHILKQDLVILFGYILSILSLN